MRNITVTVSDETYRRARVWAAQRDSCISQVVRILLETLPQSRRAASLIPAPGQDPAASSNRG